MNKILTIKTALKTAKEQNQIVGVTFIKKNGELRTMAFREGIPTGVKGTAPAKTAKRNKTLAVGNMISVFDLNKGFRTIPLNAVKSLTVNGKTIQF